MIVTRTPDTDGPELFPPIGVCPQDCPGVVSQPSTITVDTLADTGPLEVTGALLIALGLVWVGLTLRGRPALRRAPHPAIRAGESVGDAVDRLIFGKPKPHDSSTTTTGEQL